MDQAVAVKPQTGEKAKAPGFRFDPEAGATAAGVLIGLHPKDTKYLLQYLACRAQNVASHLVCIRCGTPAYKRDSWSPADPLYLISIMRQVTQNLGRLLGHVRRMPVNPVEVPNRMVLRNGFCENCYEAMKERLPPIMALPVKEDTVMDELRGLVVQIARRGLTQAAIYELRSLLREE